MAGRRFRAKRFEPPISKVTEQQLSKLVCKVPWVPIKEWPPKQSQKTKSNKPKSDPFAPKTSELSGSKQLHPWAWRSVLNIPAPSRDKYTTLAPSQINYRQKRESGSAVPRTDSLLAGGFCLFSLLSLPPPPPPPAPRPRVCVCACVCSCACACVYVCACVCVCVCVLLSHLHISYFNPPPQTHTRARARAYTHTPPPPQGV